MVNIAGNELEGSEVALSRAIHKGVRYLFIRCHRPREGIPDVSIPLFQDQKLQTFALVASGPHKLRVGFGANCHGRMHEACVVWQLTARRRGGWVNVIGNVHRGHR